MSQAYVFDAIIMSATILFSLLYNIHQTSTVYSDLRGIA